MGKRHLQIINGEIRYIEHKTDRDKTMIPPLGDGDEFISEETLLLLVERFGVGKREDIEDILIETRGLVDNRVIDDAPADSPARAKKLNNAPS